MNRVHRRTSPEKLVIEPTTRCNFKCDICVKQSSDCRIEEGDCDIQMLTSLRPAFKTASTAIFTGIGEPLIHPDLERLISYAKQHMAEKSTIGCQANGKLLTGNKALSLFRAGLNKVCISLDTTDPGMFQKVRSGGKFGDVLAALTAVESAQKKESSLDIEIGVEVVLMKKNVQELPKLVQWASSHGIDFILEM